MSALDEIAMSYTAVNAYAATNAKTRNMSAKRRDNLARYAATMRALVSGRPLPDEPHRDAVENFLRENGVNR